MHTLKRDDIELELRFRHRRTDTSSHKYRGEIFGRAYYCTPFPHCGYCYCRAIPAFPVQRGI